MRKRSKYRPRPVDHGAWLTAINMQQPMTDADLDDLGKAVHMAQLRMRLGRSVDEDFGTLAAAANVSLILCEWGVGPEHIDVAKLALDALVQAAERNRRLGKWGFSGPELQAVNAVITLHEQQIANIPRALCRDALLEVRRRAERGDVLNAAAA